MLADTTTVTCAPRAPQPQPGQSCFVLTLTCARQEIENQYVANPVTFARVLQYLNADIAQDVFLRLPGRADSVAAIAASYPRQYGTTGRSAVLLVFPVPVRQLRRGCVVTFRAARFALPDQRFVFAKLKLAVKTAD